MAAKKPKKAKRTRKPERIVGAVKAGRPAIDQRKLDAFLKQLERKGIRYPKVQFVARNAPFMRQPPILSV